MESKHNKKFKERKRNNNKNKKITKTTTTIIIIIIINKWTLFSVSTLIPAASQ
jgi:hypothetical protein